MIQNLIVMPFIFLIPPIIVLFLIFREVFTWYWKLNKISNLLEKIEENTRPKNSVKTAIEDTTKVI